MKITGLDHITINCKDIKASVNFYEQIMGLQKLHCSDMGDHLLHYFQLPGCRLELIEYLAPQKLVEAGNTDVGVYRHFAVVVDDLKVAEEHFKKQNVVIRLPSTYFAQIDKTVMLIEDPNKIEIEIIAG